jgi:hypothetical protein
MGALLALLVALVVADLALNAGGHVPAGTSAVFGVAGCAAIVLVAKWVSKLGLQRPEPPDPAGGPDTDE